MYRGVVYSLALLLLVSCGGNKTQSSKINQDDMPSFFLNPPKETGFLFGVGMSEQQNLQLAKESADLRARKEIATVLGQRVSSLVKDYLGQAGIGSTAEVTELSQSVTRALSEVELVGATIEKREHIKGKMYSLAKYPLDESVKKIINNAVEKSFTSKEALLSEFRAKKGFEELDNQLNKLNAKE
ncbi:MAG: hypothetical protein GX639_07815 [Fibrobacter sp.]|nr:hypothetical protein [Fibrobacter sp.]